MAGTEKSSFNPCTKRRTNIQIVFQAIGGVVHVLLSPRLEVGTFGLGEWSHDFGRTAQDQ